MRRTSLVLVAVVAINAVLALPRAARAESDAFENGFKRELGAIGARSVVGFGVGLFNAAGGGGAGYDGQYVYPNYGYTYYGGGHPGYGYTGDRSQYYRSDYRPHYRHHDRHHYRPRVKHYRYDQHHYRPRVKHRKHHEYYESYRHDSCGTTHDYYEYRRY